MIPATAVPSPRQSRSPLGSPKEGFGARSTRSLTTPDRNGEGPIPVPTTATRWSAPVERGQARCGAINDCAHGTGVITSPGGTQRDCPCATPCGASTPSAVAASNAPRTRTALDYSPPPQLFPSARGAGSGRCFDGSEADTTGRRGSSPPRLGWSAAGVASLIRRVAGSAGGVGRARGSGPVVGCGPASPAAPRPPGAVARTPGIALASTGDVPSGTPLAKADSEPFFEPLRAGQPGEAVGLESFAAGESRAGQAPVGQNRRAAVAEAGSGPPWFSRGASPALPGRARRCLGSPRTGDPSPADGGRKASGTSVDGVVAPGGPDVAWSRRC